MKTLDDYALDAATRALHEREYVQDVRAGAALVTAGVIFSAMAVFGVVYALMHR